MAIHVHLDQSVLVNGTINFAPSASDGDFVLERVQVRSTGATAFQVDIMAGDAVLFTTTTEQSQQGIGSHVAPGVPTKIIVANLADGAIRIVADGYYRQFAVTP